MKTTIRAAALLLAGACVMGNGLAGIADARADSARAPAASDPVRALWASELPDPSGRQQPLARFAGHIVVVNFWASWCGPCVEEMPSLAALYNQYRSKGVEFIGIGVDSAANVSRFLQKVKVDYPIFVAGFGGADIARGFGNGPGALPFTIVIDRAGKVRYSKLGIVKPAELRHVLDSL